MYKFLHYIREPGEEEEGKGKKGGKEKRRTSK
jgi:hypothetical protein